MLRNFPHQINQLDKIHAALNCFAGLLEQGSDPLDDGNFGYELARKQIYSFRGQEDLSREMLEQRIQQEQRKKPSDQGARTFARDLRRTLDLMGLVSIEHRSCDVGPMGQRLLQFDPNSTDPEYLLLWRDAILRITMSGDGSKVKPLRPAPLMLRMVSEIPRIEKRWLALAFAAKNNSDAEFKRIKELIHDGDFDRVIRRIGATPFQAANAVKIIPALLEQTGLLEIHQGTCKVTTNGRAALQDIGSSVISTKEPTTRPPRRRSAHAPSGNIRSPDDIPILKTAKATAPSPEEFEDAMRLLNERTREHQELLKKMVRNLRNISSPTATTDSYDLYAESTLRKESILFEIKTGGKFMLQARLALGQLCQYEYFDIRPSVEPEQKIWRVVVFSEEPGQEVRNFLNAYGVLTVVHAAGGFIVPTEIKDYFPID